MAALSNAARKKISNGLQRWWSVRNISYANILSDDIYNNGANTGAVADADDWLDSAEGNPAPSTGYNAALTAPFSTNASAVMKGDVLLLVSAVRQDGTGDYARRITQREIDD